MCLLGRLRRWDVVLSGLRLSRVKILGGKAEAMLRC